MHGFFLSLFGPVVRSAKNGLSTAHFTVWTMWFSVVTVNPTSNPIIPEIHTFEDVIPDLL